MRIRRRVYLLVLVIFLSMTGGPRTTQGENLHERAYRRFLHGDISGAEADFKAALDSAEKRNDPYATWHALISLGWFSDERGSHMQALEYSNQSLELAQNITRDVGLLDRVRFLFSYGLSPLSDQTYLEGRSLSWIAWAYSGMGRYEAAKALYQRAVELGAPNGNIKHVMVWGLSTQELGWLMYKMGDYEGGKKKVLSAYKLASENGIDIGVAECGTILAEMELLSGNLKTAMEYSDRAERAARRSNITPFNIGASSLIGARIIATMAETDDSRRAQALQRIAAVEQYAQTHDLKRILAYSFLIKARLLDEANEEERAALLQKALSIVNQNESELRGVVSVEVGRELAQRNEEYDKLARFYVERGINLSKEMLREVDKAHMTGDLAAISMLDGDLKAYLNNLADSANAASKAGQLPLSFEKSDQLSRELSKFGYKRLALEWARRAYGEANDLLTAATTDSAKRAYARHKTDLSIRLVQLQLELEPPRAGL